MKRKLLQILTAANVIETARNYAMADDPLLHSKEQAGDIAGFYEGVEEGAFWKMALEAPEKILNRVFALDDVILSDWVARIPGLAFQPESARLKDLARRSPRSLERAYPPQTRSMRVMSGLGTLRLPQGDDGAVLGSLSRSGNVAEGIPALLTAEVWERISRNFSCEGIKISVSARWVPMTQRWATSFPAIRDLPRGYLLLDNPKVITVREEYCHTFITPFSIMEYESGGSLLFDYIYHWGRTNDEDSRDKLIDAFERYRKKVGPTARYLTEGDMIQPLWDAEYHTPADLRKEDDSARSQLNLLEARVRENMLGKQVIGPLLEEMGERITSEADLVTLSGEIGLPVGQWLVEGRLAEQVGQFVDAAAQNEKLDELALRLEERFPGLLLNPEKE